MTLGLSNGVYPTEYAVDNTVPAAMTRAGGIVGWYAWGPVLEAILLDSEKTQVATFGLPNEKNFKDWFLANEFLAESGSLRGVRVVGDGASNAIVGGAGSGLTLDVNAINGEVVSVAINVGGTNYNAGDIVEILPANSENIAAEVRVERVDAVGAAIKVTLLSTGTGHQTGTGTATTARVKFLVGTDYEFEEAAVELPPLLARYPGDLGNNLGVSIVRAAEYYGSFFEDRFPIAPAATLLYLSDPAQIADASLKYDVPLDVLQHPDLTLTYENAEISEGTLPGQWSVSRDNAGVVNSRELTYHTDSQTVVGDGKKHQFVITNDYGLDLFSAFVAVNGGVELSPRFDGIGNVPAGFFDIDPETLTLTVGSEFYAANGDSNSVEFEVLTQTPATVATTAVTVDGIDFTVVSTAPAAGEVQLSGTSDGFKLTFEATEAPPSGLRNVQVRWGLPVGPISVVLGRPTRTDALKLFANMTECHAAVFDSTGKLSGEKDSVLEPFQFLSLVPGALNEDGTSNYYIDSINARSRYIRATPALTHFGEWKFGRGSDGAEPTDAHYLAGYEVFRNKEDYEATYLVDVVKSRTVSIRVIELMQKRADGVTFTGAPSNLTLDNRPNKAKDIIDFKRTLIPSNYGHFNPTWMRIFDRFNNKYRWIPATGTDAGMYARTHREMSMWEVPAGYNRGFYRRAERVSYLPNESERDQLQPNGINYVVRDKGSGFVLLTWVTMQEKKGLFQDMNVRYLSIYCKVNIAEMLKYIIAEINDEITRAQVRNAINPFLARVKSGRGVYDYRTRCDDKNNPPEVVDQKILKVDVYIKPARLIEGIDLRLIYTKSGVSFEEIVMA
uniref:Tail sheath n=1 Tax=Ochrobactrum phage ORM_20 TaxID=2985243 RepID=A0A9N6WTT7_9VIRU|nr:tail sheath [Ochrobactrum phage ORM_20]